MTTGFQPLFDKLVHIRYLALVRPAIPEYVDPIKCWYSFYYTLNSSMEVVFSTDKKPGRSPTVSGKFCRTIFSEILIFDF